MNSEKPNNSANVDHILQTEDGQPYEIPLEGSLGLLAHGYVGLMAWRQKKMDHAMTLYQQAQKANPTPPEVKITDTKSPKNN